MQKIYRQVNTCEFGNSFIDVMDNSWYLGPIAIPLQVVHFFRDYDIAYINQIYQNADKTRMGLYIPSGFLHRSFK